MSNERESEPGIPVVTKAPKNLDPEYIRNKLDAISKSQARQNQIEAERTGAAKNTSRLVAIFGAFITSAALAGFGWIWHISEASAQHGALIERVSERLSDHDPAPVGHQEIEAEVHSNARRIESNEATTHAINERLDRNDEAAAERQRQILEELRRLRASTRRGN